MESEVGCRGVDAEAKAYLVLHGLLIAASIGVVVTLYYTAISKLYKWRPLFWPSGTRPMSST
jgi:hypothetical protein